ncbi:metaxin-1 isoform X1 [Schistocerca piceifrons]|uniref:metaxin-1 n=2 Tax=Schistocerca TaxID=7008 RepID=UPI001F5EF983|nr:metaxin-1 isoform X1 [Schistocerca piceifrons]XP_049764896.1 metaxin-1 [Schistocerca cancellata]XP_049790733.1 metaxin-1 isoform X2 [Schistocerca nitens]XP_049937499.1 metaxin-1 isoform X1 [Schistocerca serialis cubense]
MNHPMELDVWAGDWGLASVDLHCLEVMAYATFCGVPLQYNATNNPFRTPKGKLPVFRHGSHVICGFDEICSYLRKKNFIADYLLIPKQQAEIVAFSELLKQKLYPSLQFAWWVDEKNYIELTRPWYSKALPFPYNYYYPGKYEKEAKNMMSALFGEDEEFSALEANVYSEGEKCLNDLSTRLGENDFFFGSHPTSLDAKVYAYLAPLLKAPFPNAALQNHLKACDNLLKFVVRVSHRYFPKAVQDYEMKKLSENNERAASKESDFPNKRRNQILAGLFATVAMTGYALSTGLVGVKLKDDDDDDSEELAEYQDLFENSENTDS